MNNNSPHILNTSSNLLGFTFLVLTSIKGLGLPQGSHIDEAIAFCVLLFSLSTFFSFSSMRARSKERGDRHESVADILFLCGITILTILCVFLALDILIFVK